MTMDTMLFVGCSGETPYAIDYARGLGARTILADYYPVERNPLKATVDEHWEVDVKDVDRLELLARDRHVTAVFTGSANEMCNDTALELCRRLGLPTLSSPKGWKATRDKMYFKQIAEHSGLPVARTLYAGSRQEIPRIEDAMYPVVVKPVDCCASRGVSICRDGSGLERAWLSALESSETQRALVEQYVSGEFVELFFLVHDGTASLLFQPRCCVIDRRGDGSEHIVPAVEVLDADSGWPPLLFGRYTAHPDGLDRWNNFDLRAVDRFVDELAIREGLVILQGIDAGDSVYFFEICHRLDGGLNWKTAADGGCVNLMELLVDGALGRRTSPDDLARRLDDRRFVGGFGIWASPGTVHSIEGVDLVNAMDGLNVVVTHKRPGSVIPEGPRTVDSLAFTLELQAEDETGCLERIHRAMDALHVFDVQGRDLLVR